MTINRPPSSLIPGVVLVILSLLMPAACSGADGFPTASTTAAAGVALPSTPATGSGMRVLFIGNSLTATNDVPSILHALALATGQPPPAYTSVLLPGAGLEDHWHEGTARRMLAGERWDVVVLQQGPSALPASRVDLLEYTRRFAEEILRAGATPALYMVWPSRTRFGDFERVIESYTLAAQEVGGLLFPAGEAWRATWRRDPGIELYSEDGLHPTVAGSYLAALVMYERLYHRPSTGLPASLMLASGETLSLPPALASLLQEAATEANRGIPGP